jgi:serine protease Do
VGETYMDENMNKDFELNNGENVGDIPKTEPEQTYAPKQEPVTPPTGYSQNYNPQYTYNNYNSSYNNNNRANQYMPYGSYNYGNNYQQPQQKKSKGKKKGCGITFLILVVIFFIAIGVLISAFTGDKKSQTPVQGSDDTQMTIVETPKDKILAEDVNSAGDVYKRVKDSSVGVLVYTRNQQSVYSEGTGVVMGLNGDKTATYVVTCAHVIEANNPQIIVQSADGTQYDAVIVGTDVKTDIGLLRVNTTELQAAEFAASDSVEVGDTVYAIGNPGGTQFFGSFTNGMVSAIGRPIDSPVGYEVACVQHTAAINPGNSGGALVNEYGQVIGINSSKIASTEYEGMGFAVPTATVKEIVDELIKNGYVSNRPVLGINFTTASQNQTYSIIVKANKLPAGSIVISSIMNGSDLLNTEVKEGDMIIAVNGKDLDSYEVLLEVIENGKVGDVVTLKICRVDSNYNISTFDVNVKLVEDSSTSVQYEEPIDNGFYFPFGN